MTNAIPGADEERVGAFGNDRALAQDEVTGDRGASSGQTTEVFDNT